MVGKMYKSKWCGKEEKMGKRKQDVWAAGMNTGTSGYYRQPHF